jgi:hypothetical protein
MPDFQPNDSLLWDSRDNNGFLTRRPVVFLKQNGDGTGDIGFGLRADGSPSIQRVPLAELSREAAPAIRPEYRPVVAAKPPPRIDISIRREALRQCHTEEKLAADKASQSAELLQRALSELTAAEQELGRIERIEKNQVEKLTAAIRSGTPLPNGQDHDFQTKSKIATRIALAESAVGTFTAEHRTAETNHRTAKAAVASAASAVVASVIETHADDLREMEAFSSKLRSSLRSAIEMWPTGTSPVAVHAEVVGFLVQEPNHSLPEVAGLNGRQTASENRQRPFKAFYESLLTDPEAVFEWQ